MAIQNIPHITKILIYPDLIELLMGMSVNNIVQIFKYMDKIAQIRGRTPYFDQLLKSKVK